MIGRKNDGLAAHLKAATCQMGRVDDGRKCGWEWLSERCDAMGMVLGPFVRQTWMRKWGECSYVVSKGWGGYK